MEKTDTYCQKILSFFNNFFLKNSQNCERVQSLMEELIKRERQNFIDNEDFKQFISLYLDTKSIENLDQKINNLFLKYQQDLILNNSKYLDSKLDEDEFMISKDQKKQNYIKDQVQCQEEIKETETHNSFEGIKPESIRNQDPGISIYKIKESFSLINSQLNLISNLKKKAKIDLSESEIFEKSLEAVLNMDPDNIYGISKLGQKLKNQYIQVFNSSDLIELIKEYLSNPSNFQLDQTQIKSEFIRFSNENKFKELIEDDSSCESDPVKIFEQQSELILSNKFSNLKQVEIICQSSKDDILQKYNISSLKYMICIYEKVQILLNQKKINQEEKEENKNEESQIQDSVFNQSKYQQNKINNKVQSSLEQVGLINRSISSIQEQSQSNRISIQQQNKISNEIDSVINEDSHMVSTRQNIFQSEKQVFIDNGQLFSNECQKMFEIKKRFEQINSQLNINQIIEMVQEMRVLGYQSPIYIQNIQGQNAANKIVFDFHLEMPFLNLKTHQVCQLYFQKIKIELSEKESKQIIDQYFYKIPSYEMKQEELEKLKQIEDGISQYPFIKEYIQQICPLSIKEKIQQLFDQLYVDDDFLRTLLINSETSQEKLQTVVEKYKLNKDHEDFFIVEQIFQNVQLNSLYLKSLLLLELNKPRNDENIYFSQIYSFLKEFQENGLEVLKQEKFQTIIQILKINESDITSEKLKNLDNYSTELLLITCTSDNKKIMLIDFILRKVLQMNDNQIIYLSKQILRTGLKFLYQTVFDEPQQVEKKLQKIRLLRKIYGRDLNEVENKNITFYCDFELQFQIQNKREKIFKLNQFIDINLLLEYQNSQVTQIQDWTKEIADLYRRKDPNFSQKLFDLIIYLVKRNQNIDSVYQTIQEKLMKCVQEQERMLINKRVLTEYLMQQSDSQSKFKLTLMLGFANPIPLLKARIVKQSQQNAYQLQQSFCYESFWLLKEQDKVVASLGIGFQKGKSQFLNEVFATNFAISDNTYSFIQSADIQSNHIFLQNKRQYYIADFHGDASQLEEQFIIGFFVFFIIQVNVSVFQKNQTDSLKKIIKLLESKKKKFCIIIRDFEEQKLSYNSQYENQKLVNDKISDSFLKKYDFIPFPNTMKLSSEKKEYYLTDVRIQLDNLILEQSKKKFSRDIFLKKILKPQMQIQQTLNFLNMQKNELEIQYQVIQPFQQVFDLCEYLKSHKYYPEESFHYYTIFSKYQKQLMELNEKNFKISDNHQLVLSYNNQHASEFQYKNLKNQKDDQQRSEAIKKFENLIFNQNFYINMLLFIQELKDVNNFKIGKLKAQKQDLAQQRKKKQITQQQKDQIQKEIQVLDQQILDNSISVELFWREIIQQWEIRKNNFDKDKIIQAYAQNIYNGFPFEIIDGETFYYPFDFLQKCFSQPNFKNKKFCIISIIGPQNSGKSTLLNYFLGCDFYVSEGRCTRGIYGTLVKSKVPEFDYILVIDSEGLLSLEKDDPDYDRKLTLFCLSISQFLIINVKDQLTPEMTRILEICVEVSSDLKANQIPKRVIEIVFNQKSDPNSENNRVALNKALDTIKKNAKISDHIEISVENASELPIAFSQQYLKLKEQSQNWSYLKTQITFVEGIQILGDKIIQSLIRISQENEQKIIRVAQSIPDLLDLMKNIYETIKENSDLTAFRDVLHKKSDQEVKTFVKQEINKLLDKQFQQKINDIILNAAQNQNNQQNDLINQEFEFLESLIKLTTENQFKSKISDEIISSNLKYLNSQIVIQKNDYLSTIHFTNQLKDLDKSIEAKQQEILRLASQLKQKTKDQQIQEFYSIFQNKIQFLKDKSERYTYDQCFACIVNNYKLQLSYDYNHSINKNYCFSQDIQEILKIGQGLIFTNKKIQNIQKFDEKLREPDNNFIKQELMLEIYLIVFTRLQLFSLEKITYQDLFELERSWKLGSVVKMKMNDSKFDDLNKRLFENFKIKIKESFFQQDFQQNKIYSTDQVQFLKFQDHIEMELIFSDNQRSKDELEKIKQKLNKIYDEKYKNKFQFLSQYIYYYQAKKENLKEIFEKKDMEYADYCRDFFIQQVKSKLNKNAKEIINFQMFFQNLNDEIIKSINSDIRSKIDKELISKIANLVQEQIKKANQTLSIFSEELSQRAIYCLNNIAIQQLFKQDQENKKNIINKPINEFQKEIETYKNYFLTYASQLVQKEKELAIRYAIIIQQVCQNIFNKESEDIIENYLLNYKDTLSKQSIIKQFQESLMDIQDDVFKAYIYDANSVIIEIANQNSEQYIKKVHEKIQKIKQKIKKSVQNILKNILAIIEDFNFSDSNFIYGIMFNNKQNEIKRPNEEQKVKGFQEFVFQILLDENKDISIDNYSLNISLSRPTHLKLEEYGDKEIFNQIFQNKPSFVSLESFKQFYFQLGETVKAEKLFDKIQDFSTRDIRKEFVSINDNLGNCKAKCPSCGQVCDQDHWKYPHIKIGEEQNKHTVDCGHRFASFNGVKVQKENIPANIMCSDYEENTQIIYQQKCIKWKNFMKENSEWEWNFKKENGQTRMQWQKMWKIVGQDICQKHGINYLDRCDIDIVNKCKSQVNPIHFIFAFDESGSMNGEKWSNVRDQLENFIKKRFDQSAQDVCTLIGFNNYAFTYLQLQDLNLQILEKIKLKNKGGSTCFRAIFKELIKILNLEQNGEAPNPEQEIKLFKDNSQNLIKQIHLIGFGNGDFKILEQMAEDLIILNAQFSKVTDIDQLSKQFENLVLVFPNQSI
ncbi:hypothetical protein ABPG72_006649 [Tetrahymena utriculariae]